jgi:hypothetical protein
LPFKNKMTNKSLLSNAAVYKFQRFLSVQKNGRIKSESVAGLLRNGWPEWIRISGHFQSDYARALLTNSSSSLRTVRIIQYNVDA